MDSFTVDKFNDLLDEYLEFEDQKAHIREGQKAIKSEMATVLDESKSIVNKVVSYIIKQRKNGEDEIGKIYEIIANLEK